MKNLYLSALEPKKSFGHWKSVPSLSSFSPQFQYIQIRDNYLNNFRHFITLPNFIKIIVIISRFVNGFSMSHPPTSSSQAPYHSLSCKHKSSFMHIRIQNNINLIMPINIIQILKLIVFISFSFCLIYRIFRFILRHFHINDFIRIQA